MASVFDASALIHFLYEKKTDDKNLDLIVEDGLVMSSLNLAEFFNWIVRNGLDLEKAKSVIENLEIEVADFDRNLAEKVAEIYPKTEQFGLSVGDRACLIVGILKKSPVYTGDKIWRNIEIPGLEIVILG